MAKKEPYSRKSKYTLAKRKEIAHESLAELDTVIGDRYGVSSTTVQNWRRAFKLTKPDDVKARNSALARAKMRTEKAAARRRARSNGAANGHTLVSTVSRPFRLAEHLPESAKPVPATFDSLRVQLQTALAQIDQMQANWLRVFGGRE